jgi:excinuclease ABC subunit A
MAGLRNVMQKSCNQRAPKLFQQFGLTVPRRSMPPEAHSQDKRDQDLRTNGLPGKGWLSIRGARQNNLKDIDLDLERRKLIVFSGPSGSGKSSLAFDTIYAEGQRRYVESLSAYARQFLDRMDKPDVDYITGLSPAIAIEQKASPRNPRSTVATQTEIYDHLRLLFARIGRTYSPVSGEEVKKDSPRSVADDLHSTLNEDSRFLVCIPFPSHKGRSKSDELAVLVKRGFHRIVVGPTARQRASGAVPEIKTVDTDRDKLVRIAPGRLFVLIDRLVCRPGDEENASRIADSVEMAFREGYGSCVIHAIGARDGDASEPPSQQLRFSEHFERDGIHFEDPTPQLFSFNSPLGACAECQGFGRVAGIDHGLVIPNDERSIRQGAIAPFSTDQWKDHYRDLIRVAARTGLRIDIPYLQLSEDEKKLIWEGKDDYIGIDPFFKFLKKHAYKMQYRIFTARFRGYTRCPACDGYRLKPEALYVKVAGYHVGQVCELTIGDAQDFFEGLELSEYEEAVAGRILEEIRGRLRYLNEVGLDYLSLDRLSHTLSGGESQRINLATSLGSSLVGSMYVLDEPSIGLHARDTDRLVRILEHLRDIGNTVVVVEHDEETIRRADTVVDLGPGAGVHGGEVVFSGNWDELLASKESLTGAYLSGRKKIAVPEVRRTIDPERKLVVHNAREHNLKRLDVEFPLGLITCVTGVSGSGKSTLVHDTLYAGLARMLGSSGESVGAHDGISGAQHVKAVEMVDQSPIGRTPRSNPVTYIKVFSAIRELLSATHEARIRGYRPGFFSFNVAGGRCEVCQGDGFVKIEMQFLADLYLECEACKGTRFGKEALNVRYKTKNVAEILNMTVEEAIEFFDDIDRVASKLRVLDEVGLGYLKLGQPATTLSGGEGQRVKLAAHLARPASDHTIYFFDEPTIGLHFDDIEKLLRSFNALVDRGHTIVLIEHNLDVVKSADWIIDLGPEGGRRGGFVIAEGTPEQLAVHSEILTGAYLKRVI